MSHQAALVCDLSWADRRCGSFSQQTAGMSLETSPADLWIIPFETSQTSSMKLKVHKETQVSALSLVALHVSMSAEASFPLVAKWIRINLPYSKEDCRLELWLPAFWYCSKSLVLTNTYKAGWVVIPNSFGITISLQKRIGGNDLIFQWPLYS